MKQLEPISEILNILAKSYPAISKELTKLSPNLPSNSRERKLKKIELLMARHRTVFLEIADAMYKSAPEATNPLGYSSKSLFTSIEKMIKHEREAGSYGSKYDIGQGEIE